MGCGYIQSCPVLCCCCHEAAPVLRLWYFAFVVLLDWTGKGSEETDGKASFAICKPSLPSKPEKTPDKTGLRREKDCCEVLFRAEK